MKVLERCFFHLNSQEARDSYTISVGAVTESSVAQHQKKLSTDWANRFVLPKNNDSEYKSSSMWKSGAKRQEQSVFVSKYTQ